MMFDKMVNQKMTNQKTKHLDISDDEDHSDASNQNDSDAELMAAFRTGAIQPGSVLKSEELKESRKVVNNLPLLQQFVSQTVDLINKDGEDFLADFAEFPMVMIKEDEAREESAAEHAQKTMHNLANDDFKREALFAMEAKASVLQAFEKLKDLDIPIGRPTDFYAEMSKDDKHMNKIKSKIISKKDEQERREKLRKLREQRKHGKAVQQEVSKKRAAEKQEFARKIKKARKDKTGDALFDDDEGVGGKSKKVNFKRVSKDQKYGKSWGGAKGDADSKSSAAKSKFSKSAGGPGSSKAKGSVGKNSGPPAPKFSAKGKFSPRGTGKHPNKIPGKSGGKVGGQKRPGKAQRTNQSKPRSKK